MELILRDTDFRALCIFDTFNSLIWSIKYDSYGDFEMSIPLVLPNASLIQEDFYFENKFTNGFMIIEKLNVVSDYENGDHLIISGSSLEKILLRREILEKGLIDGPILTGVEYLLNTNILFPIDLDRKISNFKIGTPSSGISELSMNVEIKFGDKLYSIIQDICQQNGLGFKIDLISEDFVFKLYSGKDLSRDQLIYQPIVFSSKNGDLIRGEYVYSKKNYKNYAFVFGEDRETLGPLTVGVGNASGLNRREIVVDCSAISQTIDGETMTDEEYLQILYNQGLLELIKSLPENSFDGTGDFKSQNIYGRDFQLGDIVEIEDAYGHLSKVRIGEISFVQDETGVNIHPMFYAIS